ncbi:MAG: enoyl-CoA hydratase-related protein [Bacteroidota bacterium]|nr:enoyl-CoA hydratase-related protein [Candidatus Kapabacteria bacterium]MDW8219056.1 enoyl-CoA hydratase-related protein [Bacteroidota bacterium]
MSYLTLLSEKKLGYTLITLNRPDKLNALNGQLLADLHHALVQAQHDSTVHAVVLTGSGTKAFAAGADISELHTLDSHSGLAFSERGQAVMNLIEHLGKPVIAAINGFALGGGCEIALACHLRFASDNAYLGLPEVSLGTLPGYGGTQRLTRLVGRAKAAELILAGERISAQDALAIGLVNDVVSQDNLLARVERFIQVMLSRSQTAVREALSAILAAEELGHIEGMHYEAERFAALCDTPDFKEGTRAFLDKRSPQFQHQQ